VAVTVRYWAGARAAAGVGEDTEVPGETLRDVVAEVVRRRPGLAPVVAVATLLVQGSRGLLDDPVTAGVVVEVLPPFAGG